MPTKISNSTIQSPKNKKPLELSRDDLLQFIDCLPDIKKCGKFFKDYDITIHNLLEFASMQILPRGKGVHRRKVWVGELLSAYPSLSACFPSLKNQTGIRIWKGAFRYPGTSWYMALPCINQVPTNARGNPRELAASLSRITRWRSLDGTVGWRSKEK